MGENWITIPEKYCQENAELTLQFCHRFFSFPLFLLLSLFLFLFLSLFSLYEDAESP
jgi:hypothetical protein